MSIREAVAMTDASCHGELSAFYFDYPGRGHLAIGQEIAKAVGLEYKSIDHRQTMRANALRRFIRVSPLIDVQTDTTLHTHAQPEDPRVEMYFHSTTEGTGSGRFFDVKNFRYVKRRQGGLSAPAQLLYARGLIDDNDFYPEGMLVNLQPRRMVIFRGSGPPVGHEFITDAGVAERGLHVGTATMSPEANRL